MVPVLDSRLGFFWKVVAAEPIADTPKPKAFKTGSNQLLPSLCGWLIVSYTYFHQLTRYLHHLME
jgi:hypothetical protein